MTRQMKNTRTGKIAVYDADLVEGGRWEEYFPPKEKPALKLKKLKGTGTLEVAPATEAPAAAAPETK